MSDPRIPPVEEPEDPEIREELERWMPPGAGVEPLVLFRTLVTHPALAKAMRPLGSYLLGRRSKLDIRHREILIDRVTARCGCEYEWGVHVAGFARAAGLEPTQVAATRLCDADAACWSPSESALVRAVDELHEGPSLSEDAWRALRRHFDADQCLEILVAAGWYRLISTLCNGLALPLEDWGARFPTAAG